MTPAYIASWVRAGVPADQLEDFSAWLGEAGVSSIGGGAPSRAAARLYFSGTSPEDLRACLGEEGVTWKAEVTPEQRAVLADAERRFPGILARLWPLNVLHGEQVLALAPRGHAVFSQDAGDVLRRLAAVGVLRPVAFRPSRSAAAFLGLEIGVHRGPQSKPKPETAASWTWEVVEDFSQHD